MVKKSFLLVMLSAFMFLASGCVTVNTGRCHSEGSLSQCSKKATDSEDVQEPNMIKRADDWVKENLW